MPTYANDTKVPCEQSRLNIERTLTRYGAQNFIYGTMPTQALVAFTSKEGYQVKFILPLPDKNAREFTHTPKQNQARTPEGAQKAWEQACRQRWAALDLVVKAKLEAVESGISEFVDEFMANIVLPDGQTAGQYMVPQIQAAYQSGTMPSLLPWGNCDTSAQKKTPAQRR